MAIKTPDSELVRSLREIQPEDPNDPESVGDAAKRHDEVLAAAWKTLAGRARDALDYLLSRHEILAVEELQKAGLADGARQFAAGRLNMLYNIQSSIEQLTNFDPEAYNYNPQFGEPEGPTDEIAY